MERQVPILERQGKEPLMLKRKIQKVSNALKNLFKSGKNTKKMLLCKECDDVEVEVAQDIGAVTCAYCVQRQVNPPEGLKPKDPSEKFQRGWALKTTYIHTDGRIFERGKDTGQKYIPGEVKPPAPAEKKKVSKKKKTTSAKKKVTKKTPKRRK
jgi:hypothetical protein